MPNLSPTRRAKIEKLMADPRYWAPDHPDHAQAVANVQDAFREAYPEPSSGDGAGIVHVRGYVRRQDGRIVEVSDYDRAPPRAGGNASNHDRPTSAHAEGLRVTDLNADGSRDIRDGGTVSWRANNPGNIKYDRFAREHGAIGRSGPFAIFPSEEDGRLALDALLHRSDYQASTLDGMIENYAPKNENNTAAYQRYVRRSLGVPGTTRLRDLTSSQMNELTRRIIIFEGWKVGTVRHLERQGK